MFLLVWALHPTAMGQAVNFVITAPSATASGTQFTIGVTAVDLQGAVETTFNGAVQLSTSDCVAQSPSFVQLASGSGNTQLTFNTSGTQAIYAVGPDDVGVGSAIVQVTGLSSARFFLTTSPNPAFFQHADVIVKASLVGCNAAATGTATLLDGTNAMASVPLDGGIAAWELPNLTIGSHWLTVTYSGDANFKPATSPALLEQRSPAPRLPQLNGSNIASPVVAENRKQGDSSWIVQAPNQGHEIEGYASATSVNLGETIDLFVNTSQPSYTIDIYRFGYYGGASARRMLPTIARKGVLQGIPVPDPATGLIECHWIDPYVLKIPATWVSGVYLAKLSAGGRASYIIFVVRDDSRHSDILMQLNTNTYEAYNNWGGLSLYGTPRAYKVSFNRPFAYGEGAADFIGEIWEFDMIRFLEKEGYNVTYSTDVDTHEHGEMLLNHKAFLVVGHGEYWSWQMRDANENARDNGVNIAYFAANTGYWQVRYEPSGTGEPDRTMVCYKSAFLDPYGGENSLLHLVTVRFRDPPVYRPEAALIGVMYSYGPVQADLSISDPGSWIFFGANASQGDVIPGLLGREADSIDASSPLGVSRVLHSPYLTSSGAIQYQDATVYTAPSGSTVFAAGTMDWALGLDTWPGSAPNSTIVQATKNILSIFLPR